MQFRANKRCNHLSYMLVEEITIAVYWKVLNMTYLMKTLRETEIGDIQKEREREYVRCELLPSLSNGFDRMHCAFSVLSSLWACGCPCVWMCMCKCVYVYVCVCECVCMWAIQSSQVFISNARTMNRLIFQIVGKLVFRMSHKRLRLSSQIKGKRFKLLFQHWSGCLHKDFVQTSMTF